MNWLEKFLSRRKADFVIEAHRFARDRLRAEKGTSYEDFRSHLESFGVNERGVIDDMFGEIFVKGFSFNPTKGYYRDENSKYRMTMDAYFRLLDYEELEQSVRSSRSAKRIAISAIVVTAILTLVQILLQTGYFESL